MRCGGESETFCCLVFWSRYVGFQQTLCVLLTEFFCLCAAAGVKFKLKSRKISVSIELRLLINYRGHLVVDRVMLTSDQSVLASNIYDSSSCHVGK